MVVPWAGSASTASPSRAGTAQANIQILGGGPAPAGYPWVVSLQNRGQVVYGAAAAHFCTGSLIAPRWVLSAGHCLIDSGIEIVAKTRDLRIAKPVRRTVIGRVVHPLYQGEESNLYDLALLYLNQGIFLSDYPKIDSEPLAPAEPVQTFGWGANRFGFPARLQTLKMLSRESCINNNALLVCAEKPNSRAVVCSGDSGGPLINAAGNLVGVTNFAGSEPLRCWDRRVSSGFARTSFYADWIKKSIAERPERIRPLSLARGFATLRLPVNFTVYASSSRQYGGQPKFYAEIASTRTIDWARIIARNKDDRFCTYQPNNSIGSNGCWSGRPPHGVAPMIIGDGRRVAAQWMTADRPCPKLNIIIKVGKRIYIEPWDACL